MIRYKRDRSWLTCNVLLQILNLTQALKDNKSPVQLVQMPVVTVERTKEGRIRTDSDQYTQSFSHRAPFFSWCWDNFREWGNPMGCRDHVTSGHAPFPQREWTGNSFSNFSSFETYWHQVLDKQHSHLIISLIQTESSLTQKGFTSI